MSHGTRSSYKKGCRCGECRGANSEYEKLRSQKLGRRLTSKPGAKVKHGGDPRHPMFPHSYTGYILGCRCVECTKSNTENHRAYVAKVNAPGGAFAAKQAAVKAVWAKTPEGQASHKSAHVVYKAKLKAWMRRTRDQGEITLIAQIYVSCPDGYHVDHIVPLAKGGWHVAENLQYLPATINMNKKAKLNYDVRHHAIRWQDALGSPFNDYPRDGSSSKRSEAHGIRLVETDCDIVSSASKDAAAAIGGDADLASRHEDQAVYGLQNQPPHGVSHE